MALEQKLTKLKNIIRGYQSCLVAFSGGVDSTLLVKVACEVLPGDKVLAVTAVSQTYPAQELLNAQGVFKTLGVRHKEIRTKELKNKKFVCPDYLLPHAQSFNDSL